MQLIDGKQTAALIKAEIAKEVESLVKDGMRRPCLAAILVGHDGGSETYVANKVKACEVCGFKSIRMAIGLPSFVSATPKGIMELLKRYEIETSGKTCVVLGRSNIVGKPMAQLMMQKNNGDSTVIVCHSHTKDIKSFCRQADIIIAALGQPDFVTADMVKPGAVIIDVGTTRVPDSSKKKGFRLNGDVKFDEVSPICSYISPVPGGVGPMTICSLMQNTLLAATHKLYK